jgi:hypothetical protein
MGVTSPLATAGCARAVCALLTAPLADGAGLHCGAGVVMVRRLGVAQGLALRAAAGSRCDIVGI